MKKIAIAVVTAFVLASCGGSETKVSATTDSTVVTSDSTKAAVDTSKTK